MDFAFSDEQKMLRQQVAAFLRDHFSEQRVVELAESEPGWDPASFEQMAALGWTGLAAPEEAGGAGMSFLEEAVVLEELGRALYPGPYLSTVALAAPAVASDADLAARIVTGEPATLAWAEPDGVELLSDLENLGTKAQQNGSSWTLTGEKDLVSDLQAASFVVVVAQGAEGAGLWVVERNAPGVGVHVLTTVDSTRRLARLTLDGVPATLVADAEHAPAVLAAVRLRALAALAAEAVGVASKVVDLSVAHAKERRQFDRAIGSYQAVSHQVADSYMAVELARSVTYWAAWAVAEGDPQAGVSVAAAKAAAGEAAVFACERAIQVHGGIGFTWEHVLHRYYKRALWIESFEGGAARQRAALASALLDD